MSAMAKKPRIMVVDDDQEVLMALARSLELEGFSTVTASDGASALSLLEEKRPDLIILDIMLPGIDGFQTLELIRQRLNIPVIMLTARHELASLQKALKEGADDYVTKPFRLPVLIARIRAKLRRATMVNAR